MNCPQELGFKKYLTENPSLLEEWTGETMKVNRQTGFEENRTDGEIRDIQITSVASQRNGIDTFLIQRKPWSRFDTFTSSDGFTSHFEGPNHWTLRPYADLATTCSIGWDPIIPVEVSEKLLGIFGGGGILRLGYERSPITLEDLSVSSIEEVETMMTSVGLRGVPGLLANNQMNEEFQAG